MKRYAEYPLIDQGYHVASLDGSGEIWGLDNMVVDGDDQRFWHVGVVYPSGALVCYDAPGTVKTKTLAVYPDGVTLPQGGTEIPAANLVALLEAEYGWPVGSRLVDGMPCGPERTL